MTPIIDRRIFGYPVPHVIAGFMLWGSAFMTMMGGLVLIALLQMGLTEQERMLYPSAAKVYVALKEAEQEKAKLVALADHLAALSAGPLTEVQTAGLGSGGIAAADPTPSALEVARADHAALLSAHAEAYAVALTAYREYLTGPPEARSLMAKMEALPALAWLPYLADPFTLAQNTMLILLAVVMGALGGVISVARAYVTAGEPNPRPVEYFIRPVFGGVMAFVIYLTFKTTGSMMSVGFDVDPISPFPVAVLGVISGLLAKEAVDRIESFGRNVLSSDAAARSAALTQSVKAALVDGRECQSDRLDLVERCLAHRRQLPPKFDHSGADAAVATARAALADFDEKLRAAETASLRLAAPDPGGDRASVLREAAQTRLAAEEALKHLRQCVTSAAAAVP